MRDRTKLFSFALCALLMLGFASAAQAQVLWNTTFTNNEVVHYGLTELMGEVRVTAANVGPSIGSTITVTYLGAAITNTLASGTAIGVPQAGGITVTGTGVFAAAAITYTSINTGLGGQVVISIPVALAPAVGDQIRINGVRTDVSGRSVGTTITGQISSSPSSANSFNFQEGLVAVVNESLTLTTTGVVDAICINQKGIPTVRLTEGFAGVFYDFTPGANPRPTFGATGNTQIKIVITGLPSGVSLSWPGTVLDSSLGGAGTLVRGTVSGTGNSTVIYQFETTNQTVSDANQEYFIINALTNNVPPAQAAVAPGNDDLNVDIAATASTGVATIQAQLWPDSASTQVPRFAHPLRPDPGAAFLTVTKCVTNILFPYVANVVGYDTGLAVANTSYDVQAIVPTTTTQSGPLTLYLYKTFAEPGPAPAPATFTVANVSAGNIWANTMSSIPAFAGSVGYIIAVAQFQYGHGFAFISFGDASGLRLAQGYVGNIIPDIALTGNARAASPSATAGSGEILGQ